MSYITCLIGPLSVGKTCLIKRKKLGEFIEHEAPTTADETHEIHLDIDGTKVDLKIVDRPGDAVFGSATNTYFKACRCLVGLFSDADSFEKLKELSEDALS